MTDHFSALQYARQLEAVGVPESQAAVHANTLAQVLDNYAQVNDLKREVTHAVSESQAQLRADIAASEARLEAKLMEKLAETEFALRSEIARLRLMNGVVIALAVAILAQGYFR